MFKRDYFVQSLRMKLHYHKRWLLEAFAVGGSNTPHDYPCGIQRTEDGRPFFIPENGGEPEFIEDIGPNEPLYHPGEVVLMEPGEIGNLNQTIVTSYGNALCNELFLVYGFGAKIPYINDRFNVGKIEKIITSRWVDEEPDESLPVEQQTIRTSEYLRFNEALNQAPGLTQLCVPSATQRTMSCDPEMIRRRDELLKIHAHEISDKVVLSKIMAELSAMDRKWMEGDPGERFYIKSKSYDVARMKLFILQGVATGFRLNDQVITSSLDEGWDLTKFDAINNQLRDGSFSRGALTALAGVDVKNSNRMFQNSVVLDEDCGSKLGVSVEFTKGSYPHYQGHYLVVDGKVVAVNDMSEEELVGKTWEVRSPAYCQSEPVNFCKICCGDRISSTPQAIAAYTADINSRLMYVFMKAMHGKSLKTARLDYGRWLS